MRIGVPKEIKTHEYRVGLTPGSVRELSAKGHDVYMETNAGAGITSSDQEYRAAGAHILDTAAAVWEAAELIIKVKEPQPTEWSQLRKGQIIFTYLHLAADPAQARGLQQSGCTAIAYETVTDMSGGLPLLAPMSEVAGRLSIEAATSSMRRTTGGRGLLMGGVPGVAAAKVVILGGGVVGTQAARMAVGLGAQVTVIDRSISRLRYLDDLFVGRIRTRFSTSTSIEEELRDADAVIGAVLVTGASAPKLISRSMLGIMRHRAILVDVAIDQGGCAETSRPTTHDFPTYDVDGVLHYCVANMPGAVPTTSSHALNNATLPFVTALADHGLQALRNDRHLFNGLSIHSGRITSRAVAESIGGDWTDPAEALQ
jgi:alanine dehydrogenase